MLAISPAVARPACRRPLAPKAVWRLVSEGGTPIDLSQLSADKGATSPPRVVLGDAASYSHAMEEAAVDDSLSLDLSVFSSEHALCELELGPDSVFLTDLPGGEHHLAVGGLRVGKGLKTEAGAGAEIDLSGAGKDLVFTLENGAE